MISCRVFAWFLMLLGPGLLVAGAPLQSGPQPGENLPGVFQPLNVTGEHAGEEYCLVCENGLNPVAMVFARQVSEPVVRLLARLDAATAANRKADMGSFAVFLSDQENLGEQLKQVAKKNALKQLVLSIDRPAGPDGFKVAKDAEVTVVLYQDHVVRANHAFKKGDLNDKAIDGVLADVSKILPKR